MFSVDCFGHRIDRIILADLLRKDYCRVRAESWRPVQRLLQGGSKKLSCRDGN